MNVRGILIGGAAFLIVGLFHPVVIKAEYHFGTRIRPAFLLVGIAFALGSLFVENTVWAAILGVFGFSCLWSVREVFEQAERVEKGWFLRNPRRGE